MFSQLSNSQIGVFVILLALLLVNILIDVRKPFARHFFSLLSEAIKREPLLASIDSVTSAIAIASAMVGLSGVAIGYTGTTFYALILTLMVSCAILLGVLKLFVEIGRVGSSGGTRKYFFAFPRSRLVGVQVVWSNRARTTFRRRHFTMAMI